MAPTSQEGFGKRSRAWQLWDVLSTASSRLPSSTPQTGEFGQRRPGHGGTRQERRYGAPRDMLQCATKLLDRADIDRDGDSDSGTHP